jgi:hypothetical protein
MKTLVFDHFQYLGSIGPLALADAGLARFSDFLIPTKPWLQSGLSAGLRRLRNSVRPYLTVRE